MNPPKQKKKFDMQEKGLRVVLTDSDPKLQMKAIKMPRVQCQRPLSDADAVAGSSCSSSNSSVNKFDVFINHRGPDTKQTMAIHMYDIFRDRGVAVFLDKEELQAGETFPEAIQEAIDSCKVHVCIFSSRYAESVWCLKELEMILSKHEMGKALVIPIFYDVKPLDVRHLKGVFGQGFEKHSRRYSSRVMDKWREALCKVSNITGYEGKGELCMTVVNRVCEKLDVGSVATCGKVVGIQSRLVTVKDDIMRYRNEGHSVTLVEITGIGGIGKTTFVKSLYNQIYFQFERHCFVENVNGIVEKDGLYAVHKQLISKLLRYNPSFTASEGKQLLKERLQNADILLVLDNVSRENCLSVVFIEDYAHLQGTSVIIVTSREQGVLKHDHRIARYCKNLISLQLSNLSFHESKEIFCHYAFGEIECVNTQFDDFINKIVNKCDGIPLALALMGRHVYGRDISFWERFWVTIKESLPPDLKKILRFSYDGLETELEKRIFLDVAIFLHGEEADLLKKLRGKDDEDDARVSFALNKLETKLLVDVHSGKLHMHDLLVDLGRTVVEDESSCPAYRSRVWHPSDVRELLYDNRVTDKVEGLSLVWKGSVVLDEDENGEPCPWFADAFSGLISLEFLILDGYCIEGDLSKLSKRLLWLKWTNFPFEIIPKTLCLRRLRVLMLSHGRNTGLWEHPPKEAPANLRDLILLECSKLQKLPEFSVKFRHMSSITLDGLVSLETIPDSFGLLQGLKHLSLMKCTTLKLLPESFGDLKNLNELRVDGCSELKLLPRSLGQLLQLQLLMLKDCEALEELPGTFGDLQNLRNFIMEACRKLKFLPLSFRQLPRIEHVNIENCCNLEISENSFEQITALESLNIKSCCTKCKLPKLPCESHQSRLKSLFVRNVCEGKCRPAILPSPFLSGVEKFPSDMKNLQELESLHLKDHPWVQLPQSIGNLSCLGSLRLTELWNLQELPQSLGNLSSLKYLYINVCWSLQRLPESLGNLSQLEYLYIRCCWNLQELPSTIGNLQNLTRLEIVDCPVLKGFSVALGNLSQLTVLTVQNCPMVEGIYMHGMCELEDLRLTNCSSLRTIAGIRACHDTLGMLQIKGCDQLSFPDSLVRQPHDRNGIFLSLNEEFLRRYNFDDFKTVSGLVRKTSEDLLPFQVSAKVSPCLFPVLVERLTHLLNCTNDCSLSLHQMSAHNQKMALHDNPFGEGSFKSFICFTTAAYTNTSTDDTFPPAFTFRFSFQNIPGTGFSHYNLGEEIHFGLCPLFALCSCREGNFIDIVPEVEKHSPGHCAAAKEGWVICVRNTDLGRQMPMLLDVCRGFYSELQRQRLLSQAWNKLPSELNLFNFSALDVANCKITRICRHCNTDIMEEETGLLWNRRRCLFGDDHALGLLQRGVRRRVSKFSFVALNVFECNLQTVVNLYEMSISISHRGKVRHRRRLQQNIPISRTEKEIPPRLHRLLQIRSSDLKSSFVKDRKVELCTTLAKNPRWYQN